MCETDTPLDIEHINIRIHSAHQTTDQQQQNDNVRMDTSKIKKVNKDQESIQSITTPHPGYHIGK